MQRPRRDGRFIPFATDAQGSVGTASGHSDIGFTELGAIRGLVPSTGRHGRSRLAPVRDRLTVAMTTVATRAGGAAGGTEQTRWLPARLGLSGRLILLTMSFVMVAQVLVFLPSVAHFRRAWVEDRIMGARMIALALSAVPTGARSPELEGKLLAGVKGAQAIGVRGPGTPWLLATAGDEPPSVQREIDLRDSPWWRPLRGLVRNLFGDISPATRVIGPGVPGIKGVEWVELVLDEAPLWQASVGYTRNFIVVSLVISLVTGLLLYLALHLIVVRPVRRLSDNVAGFAASPEDLARVIAPSGRTDEIGRAEEAVARMQLSLAGELRQKRHLADLGLAVSKINHELRNMLTTAQLLGDRLGEVEDPMTRRIAPRLIRTLDRAIAYCSTTLAYGRASEPTPERRRLLLAPLIDEQIDVRELADGIVVTVVTDIPDDLLIDVDPDGLTRVLMNLMRNAVEALSRAKTPDAEIRVTASRANGSVQIRVADNGPGVPDRARSLLFSAFQASEHSGGTGLGLPVAAEIVRLHGGSIVLERTNGGASFVVTIPDRPSWDGRLPASPAPARP